MKKLVYIALLLCSSISAQNLSGGYYHTIYTCADSTLMTSGSNKYGQLGIGNGTQINLPSAVNGIANIAEISSGANYNLALSFDGEVYSWGYGKGSELGRTVIEYDSNSVKLELSNIVEVIAGDNSSFALDNSGAVYSWGQNVGGQLGNGTTDNVENPEKLTTILGVEKLAVGQSHVMAIKYDGTVWSWGSNKYGKLGNGVDSDSIITNPTQIVGLTQIKDVAVGLYHTLILKDDGTVWSVGFNEYGSLGDGTYNSSNSLSQIPGLSNVISIKAGHYHSMALTSTGEVFTWGFNMFGQLGNGSNANQNVPINTGLTNIVEIGSGKYHSFARSNANQLFMWGLNNKGQLGDGTTSNRNVPMNVISPCSISNDNVLCQSIAAYQISDSSCIGTEFTVKSQNPSALDHIWTLNGNVISTEDTAQILNFNVGSNQLQLIVNPQGCPDRLTELFEGIIVPEAHFSYLIEDDSALVFTNESTDDAYIEWYVNDDFYSLSDTGKYVVNHGTEIQLELRAYNQCGVDTTSQMVIMKLDGINSDIVTMSEGIMISAFPNPVENLMYVELKGNPVLSSPLSVEIFDSKGRKVTSFQRRIGNFSLDVSTLSSGVYTLKVSSLDWLNHLQFIKK